MLLLFLQMYLLLLLLMLLLLVFSLSCQIFQNGPEHLWVRDTSFHLLIC